MKKYSRQREAIIEYLRGNETHPTADAVYDHVRQAYPNISLATVYRNLSLLSAEGEIRKISCGSHPDHFDFRTSDHGHFVCSKCQRVFDVFLDMDGLTGFHGELPGRAESCDVVYHGICMECETGAHGM